MRYTEASFSTDVASKIATSPSRPFSSKRNVIRRRARASGRAHEAARRSRACEWEWTSPPSPWECSQHACARPSLLQLVGGVRGRGTWSCSCSGITVASSSSCWLSAWWVARSWSCRQCSLCCGPLRYARCALQRQIRGWLAAMRCCESMHCWCVLQSFHDGCVGRLASRKTPARRVFSPGAPPSGRAEGVTGRLRPARMDSVYNSSSASSQSASLHVLPDARSRASASTPRRLRTHAVLEHKELQEHSPSPTMARTRSRYC